MEGDTTKVAPTPPETQDSVELINAPAKPRYYYVDWVRTIAIHFVVWIHCNSVGDEIKIKQSRENPDWDRENDIDFQYYT